jgi:hypothetical protein
LKTDAKRPQKTASHAASDISGHSGSTLSEPVAPPTVQATGASLRRQKAEKIIDEVLDGRSEDDQAQTRVAMDILKMEKPTDESRRPFGNVVIQGKLSLEDWRELCEQARSVGR